MLPMLLWLLTLGPRLGVSELGPPDVDGHNTAGLIVESTARLPIGIAGNDVGDKAARLRKTDMDGQGGRVSAGADLNLMASLGVPALERQLDLRDSIVCSWGHLGL